MNDPFFRRGLYNIAMAPVGAIGAALLVRGEVSLEVVGVFAGAWILGNIGGRLDAACAAYRKTR